LFSGLDVLLTPGNILGLLGPNGCGKSVLLRTLAGEVAPDSGSVTHAEGLRVVMFEQGRASLDPALTLRRALCPNGDTVMFGTRPMHVVAWAKKFLFTPEHLDSLVGQLSGGEQARLRIAQLMLQPADLLFLDEPTNDLDIPALEVLEDNLAEFAGAVVLVSHDRALMDRLCTEYVGLDGNGNAAIFGSVDQWLAAHEAGEKARNAQKEPAKVVEKKPAPAKARKLSFREQQEWDQMEPAVLAAEQRVAECEAVVERNATAGHQSLSEACKALEEAQQAVERLYARWQELEAKRGG
jgi:ATP-binding cassette subfamily F protein uup